MMIVCPYCYQEIICHDGNIWHRKLRDTEIEEKESENGTIKCEWCDEENDPYEMEMI